MSSITIRNLDDDLKAKLRVVAASHGHSMEEEARLILRHALAGSEKGGGLGSRIHARFAAIGGADIDLPARKDKARAHSVRCGCYGLQTPFGTLQIVACCATC